jgi:hypothetical protein
MGLNNQSSPACLQGAAVTASAKPHPVVLKTGRTGLPKEVERARRRPGAGRSGRASRITITVTLQDEALPDGRKYTNRDQIYLEIEGVYHIGTLTAQEARALAQNLIKLADDLDRRFA